MRKRKREKKLLCSQRVWCKTFVKYVWHIVCKKKISLSSSISIYYWNMCVPLRWRMVRLRLRLRCMTAWFTQKSVSFCSSRSLTFYHLFEKYHIFEEDTTRRDTTTLYVHTKLSYKFAYRPINIGFWCGECEMSKDMWLMHKYVLAVTPLVLPK